MNAEHPDYLADILSLRPKLRGGLKFGSILNRCFLERCEDGSRFSLSDWQKKLLEEMEGERSLSDLIKQIESETNERLDPEAVLSFYQLLRTEYLVELFAPSEGSIFELEESIFELVEDDEPEPEVDEAGEEECVGNLLETGENSPESQPENIKKFSLPPVPGKILRVGGMLFVSVGILRLLWVTSPIFEPMVDRFYYEVGQVFRSGSEGQDGRHGGSASYSAERIIPSSEVEAVSLAGKNRIHRLRQELAECRIRRDEYYLQNNEDGYRYEVERMTELARRIGELELSR